MEVNKVSFTGGKKLSKGVLNKSQQAFNQAMASALSHTDKDAYMLAKKADNVSGNAVNIAEKAKEFFSPAIKTVQEFLKQV